MMKPLFYILVVLVCVVLMSSCENIVSSEFREFEADGWAADDVAEFPFTIDDVQGTYQTQIVVRNTDDYPNQNLWLFVEQQLPNGTTKRDTVQYFLADDFGRWVGSGVGSIFENVCVYQPRAKYKVAGDYVCRIQHGMRYDKLAGIDAIGFKVVRTDK